MNSSLLHWDFTWKKPPSAVFKKKKVKNFKFRFEFFKNTQNINRIYFSTSIITEIGKTSTVQNKESNAVLIILKEGCILAIFTLVKTLKIVLPQKFLSK